VARNHSRGGIGNATIGNATIGIATNKFADHARNSLVGRILDFAMTDERADDLGTALRG
jgi:hypothetical protein